MLGGCSIVWFRGMLGGYFGLQNLTLIHHRHRLHRPPPSEKRQDHHHHHQHRIIIVSLSH
ncbi:hypothetical protein HanPI659440_Chr01g0029091 [Helianthus annuus]|nr:hypothetical protein HanPI659440_Chr01g0029091 [Helianthus annuus]